MVSLAGMCHCDGYDQECPSRIQRSCEGKRLIGKMSGPSGVHIWTMKRRMPELALHFAVPFALAAPILGVRRAIVVSLISLLPDLDVFFHIHRSPSHSVVLLLIPCLAVVALVIQLKPKLLGLTLAGSLALLSHPIMDVFSTFTPIFYPLMLESIYVDFQGRVTIGGSAAPSSTAQVSTAPTVFEVFQKIDAPIFTSEGFIVSVLLVAVPLIMVFLSRVQTGSKPNEPERNQAV